MGQAPWLIEPLGVGVKELPAYRSDLAALILGMGGAAVPIIEARNFIWQVAIDDLRKAGYSSWLGIVDQKSFEKLTRVQKIAPIREAVAVSGVGRLDVRVIDRFGRADGSWWTYDQVTKFALGHRNGLLQLDRRKLLFEGIEAYGPLDNGWWATAAFKFNPNDPDNAIKQDTVPDGIGYNKWTQSNFGAINVNLDCHGCHDHEAGNGGLKPFMPYFRTLFSAPGPAALPLQLKRDYVLADEYLTPFEALAKADRQRYADAVAAACGPDVTPQGWARSLVDTFHDFDKPLTLEEVAWEHGIGPADFVAGLSLAFAKHGRLDAVNANWLKPEAQRTRIGRLQAIEAYPKAELALRGLSEWNYSGTVKVTVPVKEKP